MAGEVAVSRKPFTRDNDLTSSVHEVLSNDDLLMEILLRLSILSLYLFKQVCKQWLALITSATFTLTLTRRIPTIDPPSGLFIGRRCRSCRSYEYDFVSFDPRIPSKRSIPFSFKSKAHIEKSCNGLLLCYLPHHRGKYSIYNPLSSMFKMLPRMHDLNYNLNAGVVDMKINMVFDPTKSPHYKVVHVGRLKDDDAFEYSIVIQTYSSETGVWSVWDDRFSRVSFAAFWNGIYWNGAIHWLKDDKPFHVKLDILDRPVLTEIQTPLSVGGHVHRKLFKSHGSLLLLCKKYGRSPHLNIYEMKNGNSEWSVKYFINLDDMKRPFPSWRMPADFDCNHILSIILGEREEDPFIVIQLSRKILQYKFMSKTVSNLLDLGKGVCRFNCHEFIASLAHV